MDPLGFAVGPSGISAASNETSASPLNPSAPSSLTAAAGVASITLSWNPSPGATGYNVYQGTSPGAESATPVLAGLTSTGATVSGLTPGTAYYFTVKAVAYTALSSLSNEASATPASAPPPASLTATAGLSTISLAWSASSGATSYNVYTGTAAGSESGTPVLTGISGTNTTISGLVAGTTYYIFVKSVVAGVASGPSPEASATVLPIPPPAGPTGLTAVAGSGQVTLSWTSSAGATSYAIYMGTTAGGESSTATQTGITGLNATVTGLTNGTTYYYVVRADTSVGPSASSNEVSATPTAPPAPAPDPNRGSSSGGGAVDVLSMLALLLLAITRGASAAPLERTTLTVLSNRSRPTPVLSRN